MRSNINIIRRWQIFRHESTNTVRRDNTKGCNPPYALFVNTILRWVTSAHSTSLRERGVGVAMTGDVGVPVVGQSAFLSLSPLLEGVKGLRWAAGSLLNCMLSVREETLFSITAELPLMLAYLWIAVSYPSETGDQKEDEVYFNFLAPLVWFHSVLQLINLQGVARRWDTRSYRMRK